MNSDKMYHFWTFRNKTSFSSTLIWIRMMWPAWTQKTLANAPFASATSTPWSNSPPSLTFMTRSITRSTGSKWKTNASSENDHRALDPFRPTAAVLITQIIIKIFLICSFIYNQLIGEYPNRRPYNKNSVKNFNCCDGEVTSSNTCEQSSFN